MSMSTLSYEEQRTQGLLARAVDYLELTKPRIAAMVLVTVVVGACVGGWGPPLEQPGVLLQTLLATALVAGSASAFNQWLERGTDARMSRTKDRPLPAGRLGSLQVLAFGLVTVMVGLAWLALAVNTTTAWLGWLTWFTYVVVYTPLKSRTTFNTVVGAVAGALPVLMGWTAVGAPLGTAATTLFLIVYLWQFPHFMAIAYLYREEYAAAGLQMLGSVAGTQRRAGLQALMSALVLLPVSLLPTVLQLAGPVYFVVATCLGLAYLTAAARFLWLLDERSARGLLRCSLVYLPALLMLLMLIPVV